MLLKRRQPRLARALVLLLLPVLAIGCLTAAGCTCQPVTNGWCGPLVSGDRVYVGTVQGKVVASDISDGQRDWFQAVGQRGGTGFGCSGGVSAASGIYGTPALWRDRLYIGAYDGTVVWLSADGALGPSEFDTGKSIVGGVAIDGDTLYVGSSNGKLFALDLNVADIGSSLKDGWPFQTGGEIWCTPVINDNVVYVASADRFVYAIDCESGKEIWRFEAEAAVMSTALVSNGMVYIGGCDRRFYAVKAATEDERAGVAAGTASATVRSADAVFEGARNWFWTQALAYDGQIWVGSLDWNVYVLDPLTLTEIDRVSTKGMVYAPPVTLGGMVMVGSQDGWIYVINPDTKEYDAYAVDSKTFDVVKAPDKPENKPAPIFAPMFADNTAATLYFHAQGNSTDPPHRLYSLSFSDGSAEVKLNVRTDKIK